MSLKPVVLYGWDVKNNHTRKIEINSKGKLETNNDEAATENKQDDIILSLTSIDTNVNNLNTNAETKHSNLISKLEELNQKLPLDLDADDGGFLKCVSKVSWHTNIRQIVMTLGSTTSASVAFPTGGFRSVNLYGGVDVGQSLTGTVNIKLENSKDQTAWYHYKNISVDIMTSGNVNSISESVNVIAPYMRLTVTNNDTVSRPVNVYLHGMKSRD